MDVDGSGDCERRFDANVAPFAERLRKIKRRSAQAVDALSEAGESYDLIYIDGDHARDAVLIDSLLAWNLLRPSGILIWDDFGSPNHAPREAIGAFLAFKRGGWAELHRGYQLIVRKLQSSP